MTVMGNYQERFRADISNTLAQLTILTVQRSDSGTYEIVLTPQDFSGDLTDQVELEVQCK